MTTTERPAPSPRADANDAANNPANDAANKAADEAALAFGRMAVIFGDSVPTGFSRYRDGVAVMVAGCQAPTFNSVFPVTKNAPASTVHELLDEVAATGLPHCLQSRDEAAEAVARERGMVPEQQRPFMVLDDLTALAPAANRPDLDIRVLSPSELAVHLDWAAAGFETPREAFAPLDASDLLTRDGVLTYVVTVGGETVATGLGLRTGKYVGVFNIGTPPAHRRKGYGAAVTARIVLDGVRDGARFALLQSSDIGLPVYERLGFRTVENWTVWLPAGSATDEH